MTEFLQVLHTTAIQIMANRQRREINLEKRPLQLDGCHVLSTGGPAVLEHYTKWYTGDNAEVSASNGN